MTRAIHMIEQVVNQKTAVLSNFPSPRRGMGKRAMDCAMYDKCLYKAAVKDWDSFNCDGCEYEKKGTLSFIDPGFILEFLALGMTVEDYLEMGESVFDVNSTKGDTHLGREDLYRA